MICDYCKKEVSQTNWWKNQEVHIELCNKCFFKDTGLTPKRKLSTGKKKRGVVK